MAGMTCVEGLTNPQSGDDQADRVSATGAEVDIKNCEKLKTEKTNFFIRILSFRSNCDPYTVIFTYVGAKCELLYYESKC